MQFRISVQIPRTDMDRMKPAFHFTVPWQEIADGSSGNVFPPFRKWSSLPDGPMVRHLQPGASKPIIQSHPCFSVNGTDT